MERIASFTVNHDVLVPGLYLSRRDGDVTTFDLRFKKPNTGDLLTNAQMHSVEHIIATFLRNSPEKDAVIYFGPMGCRTGFYLLLTGDHSSEEILPLMIEMFEFIRDYRGEVPGASPKDCGNYLDMNLGMANYLAKRFLDQVLYHITPDRLVYPE